MAKSFLKVYSYGLIKNEFYDICLVASPKTLDPLLPWDAYQGIEDAVVLGLFFFFFLGIIVGEILGLHKDFCSVYRGNEESGCGSDDNTRNELGYDFG